MSGKTERALVWGGGCICVAVLATSFLGKGDSSMAPTIWLAMVLCLAGGACYLLKRPGKETSDEDRQLHQALRPLFLGAIILVGSMLVCGGAYLLIGYLGL